MFEKFTDRGRVVMSIARREAHRLNSEFIGTEHVLLAILEESGGVGARTLKLLGIDKIAMKQEIEKIIAPSTTPLKTLGELPFSPRCRRVLALANEEVVKAGADALGTEHLLLGLFAERDGLAWQVMTTFGIIEPTLRMKMKVVLGEQADRIAGPAPTSRPSRVVSIKIWLFKEDTVYVPHQGILVLGEKKLQMDQVIFLNGLPYDKQETIAALIAKEMGAAAYLIEPMDVGIKAMKD